MVAFTSKQVFRFVDWVVLAERGKNHVQQQEGREGKEELEGVKVAVAV